jgi:hypothetical protein
MEVDLPGDKRPMIPAGTVVRLAIPKPKSKWKEGEPTAEWFDATIRGLALNQPMRRVYILEATDPELEKSLESAGYPYRFIAMPETAFKLQES